MTSINLKTLAEKLPIHPSILGRYKYFNAAVLIPIFLKEDSWHLLFQKRAANIRQEGEICFPGGGFDKDIDNDMESAAVRETIEEIGITQSKIEVIGRMDALVGSMGVIIEPFIAQIHINSIEEIHPNPQEVASVFSMPLDHFITNAPKIYHARLMVEPSYYDEQGQEHILMPSSELGLPEKYNKPWGERIYPIYIYPTEFGPIWGMTAELIRELIEIVKS